MEKRIGGKLQQIITPSELVLCSFHIIFIPYAVSLQIVTLG